MVRIKKTKNKYDISIFVLKFALFFALGVLSINLFDNRIRPTVTYTLLNSARSETLSVLNLAVEETLSQLSLDYSGVVTVEQNANGVVSAIKTDIPTLTLFQTTVSENLNSSLKEMRTKEQQIAVGSLSGLILLNGRGPKISFRISPLSQVKTDLKSEFVSAGINQTKHTITLTVSANVCAVMPGFSSETSVSADYCLSQTIIVGEVPQLMLGSYALK